MHPLIKACLQRKWYLRCFRPLKQATVVSLTTMLSIVTCSIGARISGEIARRYGNLGMESHPVVMNLKGTAGQSLVFGTLAVCISNLKVMPTITSVKVWQVVASRSSRQKVRLSRLKNTAIIGNTCLYGATGGKNLCCRYCRRTLCSA